MDVTQITTALKRLYEDDGHRIVFWNDPEGEFEEALRRLDLNGVQVLRLDERPALEVKLRVEQQDPQGRYLLYAPQEEPEYKDDWLLDIRFYSHSFRADRASILLDELGLANPHLRHHLDRRRKFFDNKQRQQKLAGLVDPQDSERDLDIKMLAVVTRAEQPEFFTIIRTLFHEMVEQDELDISTPPPSWEQAQKFELDVPFWEMAKSNFGYEEDVPSLQNLLIRLLVTDFAHHLEGEVPQGLHHLLLPVANRSNVVICLGQWRDSASKGASYDVLSGLVAEEVGLGEYLHLIELEPLLPVMTFEAVERAVARGLRDRVASTAETVDPDAVRAVANRRQAGHWASPHAAAKSPVARRAYHAVYEALVAAAELFDLRNRYRQGFQFDNAEGMWKAYAQELFQFDQRYRHFHEAADKAEAQHWDVLKSLREDVEAVYTNWYLVNFGTEWSRHVAPDDGGFLSQWTLDQSPNQFRFFRQFVAPHLDEGANRRAYVIVSDAFRYEAAEELIRQLNGRYRFEAKLASQLGVLPSYTALGMACLLPQKARSFDEKGNVLVDGKPTATLEQRHQILSEHDGLAIKADELLAMKREAGRELVSDARVVYIYHNVIDATADAASQEDETFGAVRRAIDEVANLVNYVVNYLNGNFVIVTADHGFLYSESSPTAPDRSPLPEKPAGTVKAKKRYLLGQDLPEVEGAWRGETKTTAHAEGGMQFLIPPAANRFHFTGGARFVHGGAMPQEVMVPAITVRHRKTKGIREKTKTKKVPVHVLGGSHKITTARHRFELIQMEPVSDRAKPITLRIGIYDGSEPVTNLETVTFDSASDNMGDRKRAVHLVLREREYDKRRPYRLVLQDAETGIEQQSVEVTIDRAFSDDF